MLDVRTCVLERHTLSFKTDLITTLYRPPNTDYGLRQMGINESRDCHAVLFCHEIRDSLALADVGDVIEMTDRSGSDGL